MNQIDISTKIVIKTTAVILGLLFLYLARDILALFFLSIILTATLDPAIDWMSRKKIPRPLGVFIIYIALFLMIGILVSLIIPPLVSQFKNFTQDLPAYSERLSEFFTGIEQYAQSYGIVFNSHDFLQNIVGNFFQSSGKIFSTTVGVFTFFISILVILALTFYMSVKENSMNGFLTLVVPKNNQQQVLAIADRIKEKIGKWLAGQLLLMLIIFILDFVALSIFHVPYALILALLAGILEIVPYLGPIISATLASLIGFLISPVTGLIILGVLTIIQQLESHIIVPQLMKKVVGLNPVVVILALLAGAKLGGTLGAILAIPIATTVGVVIEDMVQRNEKKESIE
jgi:predicted PurR-regulated permease PerM